MQLDYEEDDLKFEEIAISAVSSLIFSLTLGKMRARLPILPDETETARFIFSNARKHMNQTA